MLIPNFREKGTKLPHIPKGTEYRCTQWSELNRNQNSINTNNYFVSFGYKIHNNLDYIICEREDYTGQNYYMIPELIIIDLWKKQNNYKEEEFILPEKWCVKLKDNYDVINNWGKNYWEKITGWSNLDKNYKYMICYFKQNYCTSKNYIPKDYTEITFEQFKKHVLEKETMGKISIQKLKADKEYVVYIDSEEEWKELNRLCEFKVTVDFWGKHCYSPKDKSYSSSSSSTNPGSYTYNDKPSKVITINQIKEYMEKEIIGYKLIKPEYEQVCHTLMGNTGFSKVNGIDISHPSTIEIFKKAGVLNLWFEPVYKPEEKIISIGGQFNVTVKSTGIFHNNDNITTFVEGIVSINKEGSFSGYDYRISDITFSKTGCQNKETKLSDWKKVWEEYQKIKK